MKKFKHIILLFICGSILTSCFNDNDDVINPSSTVEIQDFIWKGLNLWYLYKADVTDLANERFTTDDEYVTFLNGFETPEALFGSLKASQDEFSILVDDYVALEQAFDGISKSNGMEFRLTFYPGESSGSTPPANVFGYVELVLPNTDAEAKGITRGMFFNTVDGQQLTESNFSDLLFTNDSYTIGLANVDATSVTATGESIPLTKSQYTENPVYITKVIEQGANKVGYLMYNRFTGDFDSQLNAAFGELKNKNVTDLVLDLRYNPGGSVNSAINLSGMITGQFKDEVFTTEEWNETVQAALQQDNPDRLINKFSDKIIGSSETLNSLGLSRVYILTTRSSASASELVINGLSPYIDVIQVGTTTRGKFQASITLYDSEDFRRDGADTGHTYAMQPLVLKSINSAGVSDYFNGLAPDIEINESLSNFGVLGDADEPLLNAALNDIAGGRSSSSYNRIEIKEAGNSKMFDIDYQRMYKENNGFNLVRTKL